MSDDASINAALWHLSAQVQATRSTDGTPEGDTTTAPVVPSDRQPGDYEWLRNVFSSIESPERTLKRLLDALDKEDITEDTMVETLEEISDMVEDINWAAEFALMKGPARVVSIAADDPPGRTAGAIAASSAEVRRQLYMVIAHSAQLNESVQETYRQANWEVVLIPRLKSEDNCTALEAMLQACSALCRNCPPNTLLFLNNGGMEAITSVLREFPEGAARVSDKALARTFFFMSCLASAGVATEESIELLCRHVERGSLVESTEEMAALALTELVRRSPTLVKEKVRAFMPKRLKAWKTQHGTLVEGERRSELVAALAEVG